MIPHPANHSTCSSLCSLYTSSRKTGSRPPHCLFEPDTSQKLKYYHSNVHDLPINPHIQVLAVNLQAQPTLKQRRRGKKQLLTEKGVAGKDCNRTAGHPCTLYCVLYFNDLGAEPGRKMPVYTGPGPDPQLQSFNRTSE